MRSTFPMLLAGLLCCATGARAQHAAVDSVIPHAAAPNPDAVAVIIGNRHYQLKDLPSVDFAYRDAEAVKRYVVAALGYREENVIFLEDATKASFAKVFGTEADPDGMLLNYVKPGKSDVFVYYSGHGAPDTKTGGAYFIPADADPSYLRTTGYSIDLLYKNLAKLPARSVLVAIDACFSGMSARGSLVRSASPGLLRVEQPAFRLANGTAFTASGKHEISSWDTAAEHGLFTLYFLQGLEGKADKDHNNEITASELEQYLNETVKYAARRINREQNPEVFGRRDVVLAHYDGSFATLPDLAPAVPKPKPAAVAVQPAGGAADSAHPAPALHRDPNGTDVKVRLGGKLEDAALYIDGAFSQRIPSLRYLTMPPGRINLAIRAEGCIGWDTSFVAQAGDTVTIGYRVPRCNR